MNAQGTQTPTRGRPRSFDEAAALDAALEVFWRLGYEATSLDDLTAIARDAGSPRAALQQMIRAMVETQDSCRGCLLVNCITELASNDPEVQAVVQQHIARIEGLMAQTIAQAAPPGGPQESSADRARALVAVTVGAITLRKAGLPGDQVESALRQADPLLPAD